MVKCAICKCYRSGEDFTSKNGRRTVKTCKPCRDRAAVYNRREHTSLIAQLRVQQGGACAICEQLPIEQDLALDHCHDTNEIRGLLCQNCNTALGKFKDDISLLEKAIAYLRTYK